MVTIVILSQQLTSWGKEFVTFGMSVQQISPKSAMQWNSFSPVWKLLTQKKAAQSKLLLELIYLTNKYIYWTLCDYLVFMKILYYNFLVIRWSLTETENLKSFFDNKIFIFCGYSYQPYTTDLTITFSVLHL